MSELTIVRAKRNLPQRILDFFGRGIVNAVLIVVAIFWLVPTLGLLISSLRTTGDNSSSGWWTVFLAPAQLTIDNYTSLLANPTITGSFLNTVLIAVPATFLVVAIGSLAAFAFA